MATRRIDTMGSLRVGVLAGGNSAERAVSLESGAAVADALRERKHRVTQLDPSETALTDTLLRELDVVFVALHGTFGEDGRVQRVLEQAGVPFTGSDSAVSRLAFSKSACKERFLQCGIPTPPYVLIHEGDAESRVRQQAEKLGYPLVVKPDSQGSSLGVSLVDAPAQLPAALSRCRAYDAFAVLEQAVMGTEWTVGLIDTAVLPPVQIEFDRPIFDYQAKYNDDATRYRFEFDVPLNVVNAVESAGRQAAAALETRGIVRVDLRLDEKQRPWVLEVNTVPGFTSHSLMPKAAERAGISFADLCERALKSALGAMETGPHIRPKTTKPTPVSRAG